LSANVQLRVYGLSSLDVDLSERQDRVLWDLDGAIVLFVVANDRQAARDLAVDIIPQARDQAVVSIEPAVVNIEPAFQLEKLRSDHVFKPRALWLLVCLKAPRGLGRAGISEATLVRESRHKFSGSKPF